MLYQYILRQFLSYYEELLHYQEIVTLSGSRVPKRNPYRGAVVVPCNGLVALLDGLLMSTRHRVHYTSGSWEQQTCGSSASPNQYRWKMPNYCQHLPDCIETAEPTSFKICLELERLIFAWWVHGCMMKQWLVCKREHFFGNCFGRSFSW